MAIVARFMLTTAASFLATIVEYTFTRYTVMNMSHVITEFSFGKHFPEMNQPIDNSSEVTHDSASLLLLESLQLADVPCRICRILPMCRSNNVRCPKEPLQTNKYSVHTTNDSSNRIRASRELSSSLTSSLSVSPSYSAPPHLLNSSSGATHFFPSRPSCRLMSVLQSHRRHRWHIRVCILGPPCNIPHDIFFYIYQFISRSASQRLRLVGD